MYWSGEDLHSEAGIGKYLQLPFVFGIQNLRLATRYSKNAFGWYFGPFPNQIAVLATGECISFPYGIILVHSFQFR